MNRLISQIVGIFAVLGVVVWWTNKKADERFDHLVEDFTKKQKQLEETLRNDFKKTTDELFTTLEQDRKRTEELINEFSRQDGSNDPSGIDGRFLRD